MPRKIGERTIDGVRYQVQQVGASLGAEIMFRLARSFGAILAGLNVGTLSVESLSPADFNWLLKTLIAGSKVGIVDEKGDGRERMADLSFVFDEHFAGKYPQMLEWMQFALEVNFGPLDAALGSLIRGAGMLGSNSSRRPAATGGSGDSSSTPDARSEIS